MSNNKAGPAYGWMCVLISLYPFALALGVVAPDEPVNAPNWVLAMVGIVFLTAGCMILLGGKSPTNDLLAAILLFSFSATGIWVALFSSADGFSGGVPFVSRETNVALGRGLFGIGAIITFLMGVYALRLWRRKRDGTQAGS